MVKSATVDQSAPNKPPKLSSGELTPEVLRDWTNACATYFMHKEVEPKNQVKMIAFGMLDARLHTWYLAHRVVLDAGTFEEYIEALKDTWLETHWDTRLRKKVLGSQQGARAFYEWALEVQNQNALLYGNPAHLSDIQLRNQLEANICDDLTTAVLRAKLSATLTLRKWIEEVRHLDEKRLEDIAMHRRVAEDFYKSSRRSNQTYIAKAPSSNTSSSSSTTRLGPLTLAERTLLANHNGCFKCRRFYVTHRSKECPNGAPEASSYKGITEADAVAAKGKNNKVTKQVAAVAPVTAVVPSSVLEEVSDSDDDTCVAPFETAHLIWPCLLAGPSSSTFERVDALIDHGSHLVLIDEQVVTRLGLRRWKLHAEIEANSAFLVPSSAPFRFSEYVHLAPSSLSHDWTSRTIRAIVAPNLVVPLLLGGPFLSHNCLLIDHELRTCISKPSNYDLLNPPSLSQKTLKVFPTRREMRRLRKDVLRELKEVLTSRLDSHETSRTTPTTHVVSALRKRIDVLAFIAANKKDLDRLDSEMRAKFSDRFPDDIPHIDHLPTDVVHRIHLKDPDKIIQCRRYNTPRKYREAWDTLLNQHIEAGRLRPSSSPYVSPSFLVPKKDPTALPRWVNDYRLLNANTIPDNHPLPRIDEILRDCAKGKIFGKIDMTNSFFQTRIHPDDIKYTAIDTPQGLHEWTVMPQGGRNAPATHQRRMFMALRPLIGKICHAYLDDIIIWSQSVAEHVKNVKLVLEALRKASLFCSPKKTSLFCNEIDFLGHHISAAGIEADTSKVKRILDWPVPTSASDVRSYLGLVRYLDQFLPKLADHTRILTPLTMKSADHEWPGWNSSHQTAFDAIKRLVVSRDCLGTIDHDNMGDNKIFVTCDASDWRTGAVLSVGTSPASARPVAFDSMQLKDAQLNYPVHEKELLSIVRALKKWRMELLGTPFTVYTDHRTLERFMTQRELSRRQARWQEFFAQYDFVIQYIPGEDNTVADALSRLPPEHDDAPPYSKRTSRLPSKLREQVGPAALVLSISPDPSLLNDIIAGYESDPWCVRLSQLTDSLPGLQRRDKLLYLNDRLVVPRVAHLRETIFRLAHDDLGHFGFDKSYGALRHSFYWPNMRRELEESYIPSCTECSRNKSRTTKKAGPLHPLPVPDNRGDSVAIDFIGPLPMENGFDGIMSMTDRLGADIRLVPCRMNMTAPEVANLFFDNWYCENGLPLNIISDRDKIFTSRFWKALHRLTGIHLKMSTAYHPQTDGSSERTNKTVNQALRYFVDRHQTGWVKALPRVRFNMMSTLNASTGYTHFHLHLGRTPRRLPPLTPEGVHDVREIFPTDISGALETIMSLKTDIADAHDALMSTKIGQAAWANAHRTEEPMFAVDDLVYLSTAHRRREYLNGSNRRVAKFMPRFDGPYKIISAHPESSTYTLDLPAHTNIHPTFHTSELKRHVANEKELYPSRELQRPGHIVTTTGAEEWEIEHILDRRPRGRGFQYLVRWRGYGPEADVWIAGSEVEDTDALEEYNETFGSSEDGRV